MIFIKLNWTLKIDSFSTESHNTALSSSSSPQHILKKHTSDLLGSISDPAVDLWSADVIPDPVKDKVLTTVGLSELEKSSRY